MIDVPRRARVVRCEKGRGAQLIAVGFPFLDFRDDPGFVRASERLAGFWRAKNVPHLDLASAFDGIATEALIVNRWDTHPDPRAHRLAAEAIDAFLRENMAVGADRVD